MLGGRQQMEGPQACVYTGKRVRRRYCTPFGFDENSDLSNPPSCKKTVGHFRPSRWRADSAKGPPHRRRSFSLPAPLRVLGLLILVSALVLTTLTPALADMHLAASDGQRRPAA